ncbi:MAG: GNAT family N-acetyltransferase [Anaerolineae bacterium]
MSQTSPELIAYLEELAANAWPAEVAQNVDGWRLRYTQNVTRRANSVWPNGEGKYHPLDEKLAAVEDFYARRGCPARFQICPAAHPANLDEILAGRGYTVDALTAVQIALLETILARTQSNPTYKITINESFDERWFAAYCQSEGVSGHPAEVRRGILWRIGPRAGFALLEIEGQIVSVGLGVVERGWLGLFSLTTRPEFRRQGAATALIHALGGWGQQHGADHLYLQVMANNDPALRLYQGLGFETLYHYHYREKLP